MHLMAIDPGPIDSAYVIYDTSGSAIVDKGLVNNQAMLNALSTTKTTGHLAIEMIKNMGMPVGDDIFKTCVWIGRFIQVWGRPYDLLTRIKIKAHVCGSVRAKDPNIRAALIARFGEPGTKKNPGPTFGIKKDIWAALAVAVTWADQYKATTNKMFD